MSFKKIFLLVAITPLLLSYTTHKYYLSLTQLEYKKEQQAIQITINVFMDDIEVALNKDYNIDLQLTTKKELPNNTSYFKKYLSEKLYFKINNITTNFTYIGKEYDGDLVVLYLEIPNIKELNSIEIKNNILTTHFPEQKNLVKTKVGQKNKSVFLDAIKNKDLLLF
mgnify:CR=1 FL=1